jgi:anti-sigma regulatory factor (Ser/Thr protein kinase)
LTPTTAAAALARTAVSDWLASEPHGGLIVETTRLLVSELITNSLRHAQIDAEQPLRLRGSLHDTTLRIELWDAGTHGTVARRPPQLGAGGFGLDLVAQLSSAWGVERDAHGTTVWLERAGATA